MDLTCDVARAALCDRCRPEPPAFWRPREGQHLSKDRKCSCIARALRERQPMPPWQRIPSVGRTLNGEFPDRSCQSAIKVALTSPTGLTRLATPVYSVTACGLYSQGHNDAKSVHGN